MTELFVNAFIQVRIWDILDVILVGLLFYGLYYLVKGTTAIKIFFGIVAIILILKVVTLLHMELLSYIFGAFVNVGIIALIIIFQPEVRRFLLSIGNTKIAEAFKNLFVRLGFRYKEDSNSNLDAICEACASPDCKSLSLASRAFCKMPGKPCSNRKFQLGTVCQKSVHTSPKPTL